MTCPCAVLPSASLTVWPGEFLEAELPNYAPPISEYDLEPHTDAHSVWNYGTLKVHTALLPLRHALKPATYVPL